MSTIYEDFLAMMNDTVILFKKMWSFCFVNLSEASIYGTYLVEHSVSGTRMANLEIDNTNAEGWVLWQAKWKGSGDKEPSYANHIWQASLHSQMAMPGRGQNSHALLCCTHKGCRDTGKICTMCTWKESINESGNTPKWKKTFPREMGK